MGSNDIRWEQRMSNYIKALSQLGRAVELSKQRTLSELEVQGLIQAFEFSHELAWNVMKGYFEYQGTTDITGARDAIREAFSKGLIQDGTEWMEILKSRNQTLHIYNEEVASEIAHKIVASYYQLFLDFQARMNGLMSNMSKDF